MFVNMASSVLANFAYCDLAEMSGSGCMDLSLVGAALIWFLTGFRLEQVCMIIMEGF